MSKLEIVQGVTEYNYALWERVWESVLNLDHDCFVQPLDYGVGSLRNHMIHMVDVDMSWRISLQEGREAGQAFALDESTLTTAADIKLRWDEAAEKMQTYVGSLTDEDLNSTLPETPGPLWQALVHIMNHGTDHRAQVLRMVAQCGGETFGQDMIYHFWFNK